MAKAKRATDKQLATTSLYQAFETLRSEGLEENDAIERMTRVAAFNRQALATVAQIVYRPFGT